MNTMNTDETNKTPLCCAPGGAWAAELTEPTGSAGILPAACDKLRLPAGPALPVERRPSYPCKSVCIRG